MPNDKPNLLESTKKKILIVDDHPVVRQGLALVIAKTTDLIVYAEASGVPEALREVRREKPDLILADLDLDGASGLDLIRDLRPEFEDIPVLILSMHDEDNYA